MPTSKLYEKEVEKVLQLGKGTNNLLDDMVVMDSNWKEWGNRI